MALLGLDAFNREFKRALKDKTEAAVLGVHSAAHMTILAEAVFETRIDTGHAARNWLTSIGGPGTRTEGKPGGPSVEDEDAERLRIAKELEDKAATILTGLQPYSLSYVFNNVPYIRYLNDGTDKITPGLMREKAIDAAVRSLDRLA